MRHGFSNEVWGMSLVVGMRNMENTGKKLYCFPSPLIPPPYPRVMGLVMRGGECGKYREEYIVFRS